MYSIRSLKTFWCPQALDQESKCILGSSHRTVANTPRISQKCSCHNPPQIPIKCTPNAKPIYSASSRQVGGVPGASRPKPLAPGASRGLQGPPGAYTGLRRLRGLQGLQSPPKPPCFERKMCPVAYCQSLEPWARLKFHVGWSGWTRSPTMAGGRVFLKGSEAGVLRQV